MIPSATVQGQQRSLIAYALTTGWISAFIDFATAPPAGVVTYRLNPDHPPDAMPASLAARLGLQETMTATQAASIAAQAASITTLQTSVTSAQTAASDAQMNAAAAQTAAGNAVGTANAAQATATSAANAATAAQTAATNAGNAAQAAQTTANSAQTAATSAGTAAAAAQTTATSAASAASAAQTTANAANTATSAAQTTASQALAAANVVAPRLASVRATNMAAINVPNGSGTTAIPFPAGALEAAPLTTTGTASISGGALAGLPPGVYEYTFDARFTSTLLAADVFRFFVTANGRTTGHAQQYNLLGIEAGVNGTGRFVIPAGGASVTMAANHNQVLGLGANITFTEFNFAVKRLHA